jgi:enoyl-CoA hydratase
MDAARALAEKLASKSAIALRQAKAALRAAATAPEDVGLRLELEAFGVVFASEDRLEGLNAFLQKRPPAWRHK